MSRRREDFPLEKISVKLFEGEFAQLNELYPSVGASKIIRELVHSHLNKVEVETRAARSKIVADLPITVDLPT